MSEEKLTKTIKIGAILIILFIGLRKIFKIIMSVIKEGGVGNFVLMLFIFYILVLLF